MWRSLPLIWTQAGEGPPPPAFMDGCTLAPDRLGRISHRDICDEHDLSYWYRRTLIEKLGADARWAARIIWRHRLNWPWQVAALALALIGWIGVTTLGGWMFKRRDRWDT